MAEKSTIEKILPEKASGANGHGPREAPRDGAPPRGPRPGKAEPGRWVREAKGILALALSGFGFVALYAYDPMVHPARPVEPGGPGRGLARLGLLPGLRLRRAISSRCSSRSTASPPSCGRAWPTAGRPESGS